MNTGLQRNVTDRWKIVLVALMLATLLAMGPVASDAALHTGLVPVALADGPVRGSGG